jgi:electron transfer flavoprotein alpha subunit
MATVREGVMKLEEAAHEKIAEIKAIDVTKYFKPEDFVVEILDRHIEAQKVNLKAANIIVAGGYGVGSKENFGLLYDLASVLGGEVAATRAAVDAGYSEHERQVGQTGVTVRPKLYIACGISGAVQHRAGMDQAAKIISINTDSNAPLNAIADYAITGNLTEILPKMIAYYKKHSK